MAVAVAQAEKSKPTVAAAGRYWQPLTTRRIVLATYRARIVTVCLGMLAIFAGQIAALLVPKFTGLAVDNVGALGDLAQRGQPDPFTRAATALAGLDGYAAGHDRMVACLVAMGVLATIVAAFQFSKRYQLIGLSRQCEFDLRERLYAHLGRLPLSFYSRMRSGDILSRATSDIEAVRMMIGPAVMYLTDVLAVMPLTMIAMFLISPALAAWALVPLGLLTITTLIFSPRQRVHSLAVQERQADLSARAQENFSGARVVKAFRREQFEAEQFDALGRRVLESQLSLARSRAAFQATIWTLNGAGLLVFMYFGASEIAEGRLSIGQFLEFNFFFALLYWPMIALGWVIMLVVRGRVSAKRINEILAEPPDPGVTPENGGDDGITPLPGGPGRLSGAVEFRSVNFAYEAGRPVLSDLSFRVEPGETLAIVGPVGCGKSTVAALLLRLREANNGVVSYDGKDVREYEPSVLRRQIGYVPQESFLFSESIADNITFGVAQASRDEVERAATTAQLAGEVAQLPKGYDTLLGERGVNLSGGQKQRAAIARALIKKPAVMVLDDCLSAVDTRTEEAILSGLKRDLAGTTTIIIAQRVSTVAHADEIIVLDAGRVVERGTDASLRAAGGLYAEMAAMQAQKSDAATEGVVVAAAR